MGASPLLKIGIFFMKTPSPIKVLKSNIWIVPNKAKVALVQWGQSTANNEVEMGPKEFHIIP